jgi:hypothetical protein
LFVFDKRQDGFDVSCGILVGITGVAAIGQSDGLTNYNAGAFGSGLEANVEIVEK